MGPVPAMPEPAFSVVCPTHPPPTRRAGRTYGRPARVSLVHRDHGWDNLTDTIVG